MIIPKRIKIGGCIYKIIKKNTSRYEFTKSCGYEDSDSCEIIIDDSMNTQTQESTLIHEIIEAINYKNELGLKHNQIMTLENCLYQVLKDNKLF